MTDSSIGFFDYHGLWQIFYNPWQRHLAGKCLACGHLWHLKVANCINLARCQLPTPVPTINRRLGKLIKCVSQSYCGQYWWPNLRIAHLSFHSNGWFATLADQLFPDQMQILMHFAMQIRPVAHFKSHGLSRLAFSLHFQVPIKLFSFNHVASILEYFSTNLQDWIWFCFKVVQLKEIPLLNFPSWLNLMWFHVYLLVIQAWQIWNVSLIKCLKGHMSLGSPWLLETKVWLTQWLSEWQGHLLSCSVQLKIYIKKGKCSTINYIQWMRCSVCSKNASPQCDVQLSFGG